MTEATRQRAAFLFFATVDDKPSHGIQVVGLGWQIRPVYLIEKMVIHNAMEFASL